MAACRDWRLLALIVWERRWSELRRSELYAGLALQALIIAPWLLAVARCDGRCGGAAHAVLEQHRGTLHAASPPRRHSTTPAVITTAPGSTSSSCRCTCCPGRSWPQPVCVRAWRAPAPRVPPARRGALRSPRACRFCVLLSLAATARDIYAAPALLGFALLAALWLQRGAAAPTRLDQLVLSAAPRCWSRSSAACSWRRSSCWRSPAAWHAHGRSLVSVAMLAFAAVQRCGVRSAAQARGDLSGRAWPGRTQLMRRAESERASWPFRSSIAGRTCGGLARRIRADTRAAVARAAGPG